MTRMSGAGMVLCFIIFTALIIVQIRDTMDERAARAAELTTKKLIEVAEEREAYKEVIDGVGLFTMRIIEEGEEGEGAGELTIEELIEAAQKRHRLAYEQQVEEIAAEAYDRALKVIAAEADGRLAADAADSRLGLTWQTLTKTVISLFGLLFSFLLLLVKNQSEDTKKWAMTTIGTIVGFWLGQAGA